MSQPYHHDEILTYLQKVLAIPSPSGYTELIMDYLRSELDQLQLPYRFTNKGALIATVTGENDREQRTFSAHVDTLGAMVKTIKAGGSLALELIGGYLLSGVEGANCTVVTGDGRSYSGTIHTLKPSVHISGDEARELKRIPENMEVILDERVATKAEVVALGIEVGDYIWIDPRTTITGQGFIKSRYLDDKASVAVLLYVLRYLTQNKLQPLCTTNFYLSNFEEVGHGASAGLPEKTKEFIAVDMGAPGLEQNSSEYAVCIAAKDSSGPYDYRLRQKLTTVCKDYQIPYRIDVYPHYSSDASAVLRSGWDVQTALIGPGIFASHGYERTHLDSLLATIDLIVRYCTQVPI